MAKIPTTWQPVAMSRVRLAAAAGTLLIVVACLLPCGPIGDYIGNIDYVAVGINPVTIRFDTGKYLCRSCKYVRQRRLVD